MMAVFPKALSCLISIATLVLAASPAIANSKSDCPDVRLDGAGGPFEKIPVYNQQKYSAYDPNICYAVASSELLDAYRFDAGDSLTTFSSPLSIALNHKAALPNIQPSEKAAAGASDEDPNRLGEGSVLLAIAASLNAEVCDQRWLERFVSLMPSAISGTDFHAEKDASAGNFLRNIIDQVERYRQATASLNWATMSDLNPYFKCGAQQGLANMQDLIAATRAALKATDPIPEARLFLNRLCEGHSFGIHTAAPRQSNGSPNWAEIAPIAKQIYSSKPDQELIKSLQTREAELMDPKNNLRKTISRLLTGVKPVPVGIAYCHEVLTGAKSCSANHTSVVIGERWSGHDCEFLVRDSYGEGCHSTYRCDKTSVWVPSRDLIAVTSNVYWIPEN